MKNVLTFAVILEAGFALALLILPSLIMQLLLGEQLTGIAIPLARVAGLALIGLAIACWPGPPPVGMMTYSALVTLYLAYLGFTSYTGVLLWPVVILHVILTVFLARESCGCDAAWSNRISLPELARLRHADCIEQCPLSGVTRKTFAQIEFFRL